MERLSYLFSSCNFQAYVLQDEVEALPVPCGKLAQADGTLAGPIGSWGIGGQLPGCFLWKPALIFHDSLHTNHVVFYHARLPDQQVEVIGDLSQRINLVLGKRREYLHGIGEGQAHNPRIDRAPSQNTKEGSKENYEVSEHLKAN